MKTYAFIDASNLFYGGEKSLGWKIDYKKLIGYLKEKYSISQTFYFGGVEIHNVIFGRGERTAKEIKQFAGSDFRDFQYLRERLKMQ